MMNDGVIPSFIGAITGLFYWIREVRSNNTNLSSSNRPSYFENFEARYHAMKQSISKAFDSFSKINQVEEKIKEAEAKRTIYYDALLASYNRTNLDVVSLDEALAILYAQAHRIACLENEIKNRIPSDDFQNKYAEYREAIEKFIQIGKMSYGDRVMQYAFPNSLENIIKENPLATSFHTQEEEILSKIEGWKYQVIEERDNNFSNINHKREPINDCTNLAHKFRRVVQSSLFLGLNVVLKSLLGICTGSFVGTILPLAYTFGEMPSKYVEESMNIIALVCGIHFLGSDLSTSRENCARDQSTLYSRAKLFLRGLFWTEEDINHMYYRNTYFDRAKLFFINTFLNMEDRVSVSESAKECSNAWSDFKKALYQ